MILKEYLERSKTTLKEFAVKSGISVPSIYAQVKQKGTPGLLLAMKIYVTSGGNVSLIELLSQADMEEINALIIKIKGLPKITDDLTAIETSINTLLGKDAHVV